MRSPSPIPPDPPAVAASADAQALQEAMATLFEPLARLAVAKGMPFAAVESLLKLAFVRAARDAHPNLPAHRMVSRIATATGLNRREVTRLTQAAAPPPRRRPLAAEVFARWAADPAYRDRRGQPRRLPRQGDAPSFESLAQSVTRDVHPRSLLDELLRLGLAEHDATDDSVRLVHDAFVPHGDNERMLGFLGHNVGDHLGAAVANVLGDGRQHFEQAVFADELSPQSVEALRAVIAAQWQALASTLVPRIEAAIEDDRRAARTQDRRLRVGLYSFSDSMTTGGPTAAGDPPEVGAAADIPSARSTPQRGPR